MNHPIPDAALSWHIAILGKTGSGKSNAAKTVAEKLMSKGERVCVIDPTGTWWGLRLDRGGVKKSVYEPVIFGGTHGDIPLAAEHGAAIAEAVGTSSTSAIIDTRLLSVGKRTKFFAAFGESLLQFNKGPLHLIIDEAHLFAPQGRVNDPQSGAMLHAANNLVSLGRGIGLRIILISQRPAKLHKDSLTQVETLVAMRLIAPQDRKAIDDWIGEWADPGEGKKIVAGLPSMKTGDAWVWSPEIEMLKRVHFPLAATFDSGSSSSQSDAQLQTIDIGAMTAQLETIKEEVVANDPAKLKLKIAELQRDVGRSLNPEVLQKEYQRGVGDGRSAGYSEGYSEALQSAHSAIGTLISQEPAPKVIPAPQPNKPVIRTAPQPASPKGQDQMRPAHQRVIDAIAWWHTAGHKHVKRSLASVVAGYSPKASTFGVYIGELVKAGLVESSNGGVCLTSEGEKNANWVSATTNDDIYETAKGLLKPKPREIFDVIYNAWPDEIHRHEVANALGLSPTASTVGVYIGAVASFGLVETSSPGCVRASQWLFDRGQS